GAVAWAFWKVRLGRAGKASFSQAKQRAGPVNFKFDRPATFTIAPSGARLPFRPTTPPVTVIGLSAGRTTSWCGFHFTLLRFSAIVRPVTVKQSPCRDP